ncbi:MAG: cyclase family protein [Candidatus Hydrothermarchaeota archaeon]
MNVIDVSVSISEDMHLFPGDLKPVITRVSNISEGSPYNLSNLSLSAHAGTHVDPPLHFLEEGKSIDQIKLDNLIGYAIVLDLTDLNEKITARDLEKFKGYIKENDIILFKTKNSILWKEKKFSKDYVYLTEEAAIYLIENGVKTIGIDYLSIEKFGSEDARVHKELLKNEVLVIEGLDLSNAKQKKYFFVCLPLKIKNGDGAPSRAILIEE